ncbi:MAG TPA: hypothetical protein VEF04_23255, partial [Blastocatellia bacterium]|nr:hypothetical protein [Blastocatellia bacterium]
MSNRKRAISLVITILFAIVAVLYSLPAHVTQVLGFGALQRAQSRKTQKPQNDREALAKNPAPTGTLKTRLGTDDGYSIVLFYSADIHGNLEVCGCPIRPLGGVARRM